jgi:eukaryotic-like serine/threonine-protein kinase
MHSGPSAGASFAGYRLLRLLGQGTQSQVFLAEPTGPGQTLVALKLSPLGNVSDRAAARKAFVDAARTAQRLVHPHIVAVLDAGVEGDFTWLAMEAVPGADLSRYAREPRLLPEAVVLQVMERVALALSHAHRQGLVHRDLKPANVLVDWASDTVKLADFGLARGAQAANTGTGIVLGTPAYMAPEQLAGAVPSAAADLYALGVSLFELLTGRLPHNGRTMGELLRQVANDTPPDLDPLRPGLPPGTNDLVTRLLAKDPARRPPDAATVARDLAQLRATLSGPDAAAGAKSR